MIKKICGIIADASDVEEFTKRDGSKCNKAILKIVSAGNYPYPDEIAISVFGDEANFAKCQEMLVEVEYFNRVFTFTNKDGIKKMLNEPVAMRVSQFSGSSNTAQS